MANELEIAFQSGFEKEARGFITDDWIYDLMMVGGASGIGAGGLGYQFGKNKGQREAHNSLPQTAKAADETISMANLDPSELKEMGRDPERTYEEANKLRELMGTEDYE